MKDILICPSMMVADFSNLREEVEKLNEANVDIFHMDIMDGHFVSNFALGIQDFVAVRKLTNKLMDVHLMVSNPQRYIKLFANLGADIIYIHPEADSNPVKTLLEIKQMEKKAGIAINPGTSIEQISELLTLVDYVMVMTVNPGFAGQKYLEFVDSKIKKLITIQRDYNFEILVDGAISPEKISYLSSLGVKGFILGSSGLFGKNQPYSELVKNYKN